MSEISFDEYKKQYYTTSSTLTQGCILTTSDSNFTKYAPKIYIPDTNPTENLNLIGLVIIENACDLIEEINDKGDIVRERKSNTMEILYMFDAKDFLFSAFKFQDIPALPEKKKKLHLSKIRNFIENGDIDRQFFYLPQHNLMDFSLGMIIYTKISTSFPIDLFPFQMNYIQIQSPHREKLINMHTKYNLRVPTAEVSSLDILNWIIECNS